MTRAFVKKSPRKDAPPEMVLNMTAFGPLHTATHGPAYGRLLTLTPFQHLSQRKWLFLYKTLSLNYKIMSMFRKIRNLNMSQLHT